MNINEMNNEIKQYFCSKTNNYLLNKYFDANKFTFWKQ